MFTPAMQPDRVAKALAKGEADSLVADLEDAVAPADKGEARARLRDAWPALPRSRTERVVRVNGTGTEWFAADLDAVVPLAPDAIVVPKVERPEDVAFADRRVGEIERAAGVPFGATPLVILFESGLGVLQALPCVRASARVTAVVFGAEDYAADVGGVRRRDNLDVLWARSQVVAVAAAAGVDAIDQVFTDIDDAAELSAEAHFARNLGYRGKMVIHPKQVPVVNEAFTPRPEEIAHAQRVLDAAAAAEKANRGAFALDGRMVDRPLVEQARRVVAAARAAGALR